MAGQSGSAAGSENRAGNGGTSAAGDAGATSDAGASGAAGSGELREFLYIATPAGNVEACSIDGASGVPQLLPGSPAGGTAHLTGIAVDRAHRFVFVIDQNSHIDTFQITADGSLRAQSNFSLATTAPRFSLIALTVEPKGRFLYVASAIEKTVYTFTIDAQTGELHPVGQPLPVGPAPDPSVPEFITADPSGHFLYLSQATPGIRGYRIDQATGTLSELEGSPFAAALPEADGTLGGALAITPNGGFLYAASGALNGFSVGPDGALDLLDGSPFAHDLQSEPAAPNVAIDPQGEYLYATNLVTQHHVSGFAIHPTSGALAEVPGSPLTVAGPYSVAIDPSGRFVFVGIDNPQLGVYALQRANGSLQKLDDSPFSLGGVEPKFAFAAFE